jgi:hypothetical protein
MKSHFQLPNNPVELAAERAEMSISQEFQMSSQDEALLAELDFAAEGLGFLDKKYFVSAATGFQVPASFEATDKVKYTRFDGLSAEVVLATYAKLHIGRIIGGGAVRAVCLCFSEGFVLNRFSEIPEDQLLYVPVLAVNEISEAA